MALHGMQLTEPSSMKVIRFCQAETFLEPVEPSADVDRVQEASRSSTARIPAAARANVGHALEGTSFPCDFM